jgi:predicted DNA-binding protein (UPF0251 family)
MPRPRQLRKIVDPPKFEGFKPYGTKQKPQPAVELLYEEYEAIKLADFDIMDHLQASKLMGVSRATFARIYESARRKIALALVEVRGIKTGYGHARFDKSWYLCNECHARFSMPETITEQTCPLCHSSSIATIGEE